MQTTPRNDATTPTSDASKAKPGSTHFWLAALAGAVIIAIVAIVAAAGRNDDRGIRGPADQAAPDAPHDEKVPPSAKR
jgi:hypothetical protein